MVTGTRRKPASPARRATNGKISVYSVDKDEVVGALVATGQTDYRYALANLVPLIDRLEIQRKIQNPTFYDRLKRDILKKCLMPPITIAFVRKSLTGLSTRESFSKFLNANIQHAFVLDGIQRLSTLNRAYLGAQKDFPLTQPLFLNVLICKSTDNLLYRMITLNNGQRPMTTRHQIEILTSNVFDGDNETITLSKEKDGIRKQRGIFSKADFVLGYIAFLSNSTTVDSQKLIQEKLDELIASKILEHDPAEDDVQFSDVLDLISAYVDQEEELDRWFKLPNNLIGFCAGIKTGYPVLQKTSPAQFLKFIHNFEDALKSFDVAKLKLGRARRNSVAAVIRQFRVLQNKPTNTITEKLIEVME